MKKVFTITALAILTTIGVWAQQESIFWTRPYLQNPTNNGMTICWQTTAPAYSWVEYGTDTITPIRARELIAGQSMANNTLNKIRLSGIEPGKRYYYRVISHEILAYGAYKKEFGRKETSAWHSFELPKGDFTALVFNDLHQKSATMDSLIRHAQGMKYDFVFFNGDCIDDPTSEKQAVEAISAFNDKVGASTVPVIYMRGNHEIRGAYSMNFTKLFDYAGGETFGAFTIGDTRIVMLDCGEDKPDSHPVYYGMNDFDEFRRQQTDFLHRELASKEFKKTTKKILLHHIPTYGNPDDEYIPCLELWHKELKSAPFNICLNGHTHQFRFIDRMQAEENNYPILIGGGYNPKGATMTVVNRRGADLRIEVIDIHGKRLVDKLF